MFISDLFKEKNLVFSLEIFPPKSDSPIESVYTSIEELALKNPDFISVTYGAGGSRQDNRTLELASRIEKHHKIRSLAHLTAISSNRQDLDWILDQLKSSGVNNVLALMGDRPKDGQIVSDFKNSQDLIAHIKARGDFSIGAACYPEGHVDSPVKSRDLDVLKLKEEAGADYFISQLFFNNQAFYDFLDQARSKGVTRPIQAGIMPVINKRQISRTVELSGSQLPNKFLKIVNKYENDKLALRDAGIYYATEQIIDLISSGVDGIHLYTMNNPYIANKILENLDSIIKNINGRLNCL